MSKPERLVSDDDVIETQRVQYRCGCGTLFEGSMPVRCAMDVTLGYMSALRCPECGDREKVYMGQDRTLTEDRSFGWGTTYEERVEGWIANGEFGRSSAAVFRRMVGRDPSTEGTGPAFRGSETLRRELMAKAAGHAGIPVAVPSDPSDLRRCVLMLNRLHEWVPRMPEMADVSPEWAALAPRWEELVATYLSEVGPEMERVPAPRTYGLLRNAAEGEGR